MNDTTIQFPYVEEVESRSRPGVAHLVTVASPEGPARCTCDAASFNRDCWHRVDVIERLIAQVGEEANLCACGGRQRDHHHGVCTHCDPFAVFVREQERGALENGARHEFVRFESGVCVRCHEESDEPLSGICGTCGEELGG